MLSALCLTACGGAEHAALSQYGADSDAAEAQETPAEAALLALEEVSLEHGFSLTTTGELSVNGVWVGRMDAQGRFTTPIQPTTFAWDPETGLIQSEAFEFDKQLRPDGVMIEADGGEVRIDGDGRILRGEEVLAQVTGYRPGLERTVFLALIYSALGNAMLAAAGNSPDQLRTFVAGVLGGAIHDCGGMHQGCTAPLSFVHAGSRERVIAAGASMTRDVARQLYDELAVRTFLVEEDNTRARVASLSVDPDSCYQFRWDDYSVVACASEAYFGIVDLTFLGTP